MGGLISAGLLVLMMLTFCLVSITNWCMLVCWWCCRSCCWPAVVAGPADAGGEAAEAEEAEPEEEKTKVQAHSGWKTLFSTTAVLHMNVRSDDGKWSWQSRGKGQLSLRQPVKDNGKTYISFNSDGVRKGSSCSCILGG